MSSRRALCASFLRLPCPVAKTLARPRYPPSPAGARPQARWDEANHAPRSPPVIHGLAQRPAGQGKSAAGQRACGALPAPLRAWRLRGSLSKGGASPSPVGAHAGHAPEVGALPPSPPRAGRRAGRHGAADGSAGADMSAGARPKPAPSFPQGLPRGTFEGSSARPLAGQWSSERGAGYLRCRAPVSGGGVCARAVSDPSQSGEHARQSPEAGGVRPVPAWAV
jgi:hypothetical protein